MTIPRPTKKTTASGGKLSLAPLTPEQALFKALNTAPPKAERKPAKKRPVK